MNTFADRELRDLFSLTDAKLGEITGKSRQAINAGLEKSDDYFKLQEWILIYIHLMSENNPNLDNFIQLARSKFAGWDEVAPSIGLGSSPVSLSHFERIVCVIADYRVFRETNPRCHQLIVGLVSAHTAEISFFTSSSIEVDALSREIREIAASDESIRSCAITVGWLPEVNQYPYLICCDPQSVNKVFFTCGNNNIVQLDKLRGEAIFNAIEDDINSSDSSHIISVAA